MKKINSLELKTFFHSFKSIELLTFPVLENFLDGKFPLETLSEIHF